MGQVLHIKTNILSCIQRWYYVVLGTYWCILCTKDEKDIDHCLWGVSLTITCKANAKVHLTCIWHMVGSVAPWLRRCSWISHFTIKGKFCGSLVPFGLWAIRLESNSKIFREVERWTRFGRLLGLMFFMSIYCPTFLWLRAWFDPHRLEFVSLVGVWPPF